MERIDPGSLYDERGEVSWSRPIFQGDVFADVVLPGFGDKPGLVQVVAHPCAMRRGPDLLSRITVAPVERYQVVEGEHWNGHLKVMPLAELVDGKHYATKFVDVTAAPSDLLTYPRRVATLSNRGIYVLQQRLVKHYTRLEVEIAVLRRGAAAVLEEAEQQRDWIETVLDEDEWNVSTLAEEYRAFDEWLSDGDPSRRFLLGDDANHTDIRRGAHQAAVERRRQRVRADR